MKKIICEILCLIFIVLFNFMLPRMMPGDPVLMLAGMKEEEVTEAQYESCKVKLGLDKSIGDQFVTYVKNLIKGDLGYSFHYNADVSKIICERIPNTLQIALPVFILSSIPAFILGCVSGWMKGKTIDNCLTTFFVMMDAIPGFLLAMILLSVFAYKIKFFPLGGLNSIGISDEWHFADRIWHLTLPIITLTLGAIPSKYLLMRNSVASLKNEPYVTYALARGIHRNRIMFIHIGKNACQPFLAMLGINLGFILSGSMVCETVFSIKGMGSLLYASVLSRDLPILQGCMLVSTFTVITATLIFEIIGGLLDPRGRVNNK